MLTYQLQDRVIKRKDKKPIKFPNKVTVEVELSPPEIFGASNGLSRLLIRGHEANALYNANTGRIRLQPKPPLEPLDVVIKMPDSRFELKGNTLRYEAQCRNAMEFEGYWMTFLYVFPTLLNIIFPDPPVALGISGKVGQTSFRLLHRETDFPIRPLSKDEIERHVVSSFNHLKILQGAMNRRLAAALHYFYTASRLIVAGNSDWEFMAESVLNMCKVLEVLFGPERDEVRKGLSRLGYRNEEIEGDFIPLMILRNKFDIGHPRIGIHKRGQLQILYRYLSRSEDRFREMFQRLFERISNGSFEIRQQEDLRLDQKEQSEFDGLVGIMKTRIKLDEGVKQVFKRLP